MLSTLLSVALGAATVSAHGYVTNIVINGVYYQGFDVTTAPYQSDPATVVGWSTSATDLGFVAPDAYGSADIICHRDGANAKGHAQVAAGDSIFVQWNTWPESHHGPVIDYLAACGDSGCESVDKTSLEFFKIDEKGLIDGSSAPGKYADDELISNGLGWMVKIPSTLKAGFYVLRHEMIALHSAGDTNGAQNYPQCFNLEVTGGGSDVPSGTLGTALYKEDDPGIKVNIYTATSTYVIPGPSLIAGAESVSQGTSAISSTGTATVGSAKASGGSGGSGSASTTAAGTTAAGTTAAGTSAAATSAATTSAATSAAKQSTSRQQTTFSTVVASKSSGGGGAASSPTAAPSSSNGSNGNGNGNGNGSACQTKTVTVYV